MKIVAWFLAAVGLVWIGMHVLAFISLLAGANALWPYWWKTTGGKQRGTS